MNGPTDLEMEFSKHRLRGDPLPHDLSVLLKHQPELGSRTGIVLNASPGWAPWLDTSYLQDEDWADPDIRANVRAIHDVCKLIDFVFEDEDRNYFGYWRGATHTTLALAPVVCLNNEGQFYFCGTANIAGALLTSGVAFEELHPWLVSLGIGQLPLEPYDLTDPDVHPSPRELHEALYEKYSVEERAA